ncbi:MAG: response regulator transcription factor [Nanoarchaeota archaeon]|nr:response regulator transcription factor [Nanoarchaeota archaeon]
MKKILYVEDDEDTLMAVKVLLETQGYQVRGATNGKEALKLIAEEDFNLILLDIMLPDMSGWDIFQKLHKDTPEKKVAFLSVMPVSEERKKVLLKAGAMDYIMKPFDKEDLIRRINKICKK